MWWFSPGLGSFSFNASLSKQWDALTVIAGWKVSQQNSFSIFWRAVSRASWFLWGGLWALLSNGLWVYRILARRPWIQHLFCNPSVWVWKASLRPQAEKQEYPCKDHLVTLKIRFLGGEGNWPRTLHALWLKKEPALPATWLTSSVNCLSELRPTFFPTILSLIFDYFLSPSINSFCDCVLKPEFH